MEGYEPHRIQEMRIFKASKNTVHRACNRDAVMPLSEQRSRFTIRFESKSIRKPKNMGFYNFIEIMGISWNQA